MKEGGRVGAGRREVGGVRREDRGGREEGRSED